MDNSTTQSLVVLVQESFSVVGLESVNLATPHLSSHNRGLHMPFQIILLHIYISTKSRCIARPR
jgi:hypothetical protein